MKLISLFSLIVFSQFALANVGFEKGNEVLLTPAEGRAHVYCSDGFDQGWSTFYCATTFVNPGSHARLVNNGPAIYADKVTLKAHHEDGSTKTKDEKFDIGSQISGAFNLVMNTVFQKPLLNRGVNEIEYEFEKDGKPVAHGSFQSYVEVNPRMACETVSFNHYGSCSAINVCDRYWAMQPRCD